LLALSDGPCAELLSWLSARDLGCADATCRALAELSGRPAGPWESLGRRAFQGIELDIDSDRLVGFETAEPEAGLAVVSGSWKRRYRLFAEAAPTFAAPFASSEIRQIQRADELAYCRCRIRTNILASHSVYVEVNVLSNADNLSLAVMDFESGGSSSVTFSPEAGAVLRERKVQEEPRVIEGSYIQLLPPLATGRRFVGRMGLLVRNGQLAFFRRCHALEAKVSEEDAPAGDSVEQPAWETTGFCTDLSWSQGDRLSVCLSFRDEGEYHVKLDQVGTEPPLIAVRNAEAFDSKKWSMLYGDEDVPLAM